MSLDKYPHFFVEKAIAKCLFTLRGHVYPAMDVVGLNKINNFKKYEIII